MIRNIRQICLASTLLLSACTPAAEGVQNASQTVGETRDDVKATMKELFTYNPRPRTPQPANTRYCYHFASDIVCYNDPQPQLTSKLVGVQGAEGARMISQPAPSDPTMAAYTPVQEIPVQPLPGAPMDTSGPVPATDSSMRIETHNIGAPFQSKESAYVKKN
jgi:hypothetical protein